MDILFVDFLAELSRFDALDSAAHDQETCHSFHLPSSTLIHSQTVERGLPEGGLPVGTSTREKYISTLSSPYNNSRRYLVKGRDEVA